jgi:O6-methylguanine-DNA--protein-cysteine methyltransferase
MVPKWLSAAVVGLLTLQVGLLWTQGSLLQRQHEDLQSLRGDVQDLAASLDQGYDDGDSQELDPDVRPARLPLRHPRLRHLGARPQRINYLHAQQPPEPSQPEDQARQELDASRQSAQQALAQARTAQSQLSYADNARKAEEKAAAEAAGSALQRNLLWGTLAVVLAAFGVRWMLRRRA